MRTPNQKIVVAAVAACLVIGCQIVTTDRAGAACETNDECGDPDYICMSAGGDAGLTCQVKFPPITPPDAGDAGIDASVPTVFWCGEVEQLMATYCASCHGEDRTGSGNLNMRLDVYDDVGGGMEAGGLGGAKSQAARIKYRTVDIKTMPPFGTPKPDAGELALINNWVLSGAQFCDGGM